MNYYRHLGPSSTPTVVSWLLSLIAVVAIFAAVTNALFSHYFGIMSPQVLLSLSWQGIKNGFIWQLVTYLFVLESGFQGISFSFLFSLCIKLYILWLLGSSIADRIGTRHFLSLFFLCGIFAGIVSVLMMVATGHYKFLAGQTGVLLGMLVFWSMIHLNSDIWLFFIFPINAKWLLTWILGFFLLVSLIELDWISFFNYLANAVASFFYGKLVFHLPTPFPYLESLDTSFQSTAKGKNSYDSKIIDISGEPVLSDDAFVDAMLTKISKYGESSLTTAEKKRLDRISREKMKKNE